jgi:hypothetical protein
MVSRLTMADVEKYFQVYIEIYKEHKHIRPEMG